MCAFGALINEPLLSRATRSSTSTRRCCRAGAARAGRAGDHGRRRETGVSIMRLTAGSTRARSACRSASRSARRRLRDAAGAAGALGGDLLVRALDERPPFAEQDEDGVTYADKIEARDRRWTPPRPRRGGRARGARAAPAHRRAAAAARRGFLGVLERASTARRSPAGGRVRVEADRLLLDCNGGALELTADPAARRQGDGRPRVAARAARTPTAPASSSTRRCRSARSTSCSASRASGRRTPSGRRTCPRSPGAATRRCSSGPRAGRRRRPARARDRRVPARPARHARADVPGASRAATLEAMAEREEDPGVLEAIAHGFGHLGEPYGLDTLVALAAHADARVREGRRSRSPAARTGACRRADPALARRRDGRARLGDVRARDARRSGHGRAARGARGAARGPDPETRLEAVHGLALRGDARGRAGARAAGRGDGVRRRLVAPDGAARDGSGSPRNGRRALRSVPAGPGARRRAARPAPAGRRARPGRRGRRPGRRRAPEPSGLRRRGGRRRRRGRGGGATAGPGGRARRPGRPWPCACVSGGSVGTCSLGASSDRRPRARWPGCRSGPPRGRAGPGFLWFPLPLSSSARLDGPRRGGGLLGRGGGLLGGGGGLLGRGGSGGGVSSWRVVGAAGSSGAAASGRSGPAARSRPGSVPVATSAALLMPSPSASPLPSRTPSLSVSAFEGIAAERDLDRVRDAVPVGVGGAVLDAVRCRSLALAAVRSRNSTPFGMPSPSASASASLALTSRPCACSTSSGMPSPSESGAFTNWLSPKFAEVWSRCRRAARCWRAPLARGGAAADGRPAAVCACIGRAAGGRAARGGQQRQRAGRAADGLARRGAHGHGAVESRLAARLSAVRVIGSPLELESAFGQSFQPKSGTAIAPTPRTPATSPAAMVPANLRSRPVVEFRARAVRIRHVRVPLHRMTRHFRQR